MRTFCPILFIFAVVIVTFAFLRRQRFRASDFVKGVRCAREFGKPRTNAGQRSHEAAGAEEPLARMAACGQESIESLLIDFFREEKVVQ